MGLRSAISCPPFQLDLVVAVLNHDSVDFFAIEIHHVLGARWPLRCSAFALVKLDVSDERHHNGEERASFGFHSTKSGPALPPNGEADHRRNQRHEDKNYPAQIAQRIFIEAESQRLRNLRRDADELLAAQQPVHARRK